MCRSCRPDDRSTDPLPGPPSFRVAPEPRTLDAGRAVRQTHSRTRPEPGYPADSTKRQSAFASRICSTVRQVMSSSFGRDQDRHAPRPRDRHFQPVVREEELDVARDVLHVVVVWTELIARTSIAAGRPFPWIRAMSLTRSRDHQRLRYLARTGAVRPDQLSSEHDS